MLSQLAQNLVERAKEAVSKAQQQCALDAYRAMEPKTGASRKAAGKLQRAVEILDRI